VGNLMRQSAVLGDIEITTQDWVLHHLTLKRIQRNDRLITAYHAHDYFFNATDFPDLSVYRDAVLENILTLTDNAEPQRYYQFAFFASDPESPVSQAAAPKLKRRIFGSLAKMQQSDGAWHDEYSNPHWSAWTTIMVLH